MIQIRPPQGAKTSRRIVGRGAGSGLSKTSGKGHSGQKARTSGGVRIGFEGGQMPLYRRVARRGFSNQRHARVYGELTLSQLDRAFEEGETVSLESLKEKRLISGAQCRVKILRTGKLAKRLVIGDGVQCTKGVVKYLEALS